MALHKRPLKRSFLVGIILFVALLSAALSFTQYFRYRSMLYDRYEFYIANILSHAAAQIDVDDLADRDLLLLSGNRKLPPDGRMRAVIAAVRLGEDRFMRCFPDFR